MNATGKYSMLYISFVKILFRIFCFPVCFVAQACVLETMSKKLSEIAPFPDSISIAQVSEIFCFQTEGKICVAGNIGHVI